MDLSNYALKLLKDMATNPGYFDFCETLSGWKTPYGDIRDPQECAEIKNTLYQLHEAGFIHELKPGGDRFEITPSGLRYAHDYISG
jgi:hypothetical protein